MPEQANGRPYWNMEIEPKLNTPEIKPIQLRNLQAMLRYMHEHSGLWRRISASSPSV